MGHFEQGKYSQAIQDLMLKVYHILVGKWVGWGDSYGLCLEIKM